MVSEPYCGVSLADEVTIWPSNLRPTTRECVVTCGHGAKMAVTPFDRPYPKTPSYMRTLWLYVL